MKASRFKDLVPRHAEWLGIPFLLVLAICIQNPIVPRLNCRERLLDARTGRMRDVRYLVFIKISDHVSDTDFSLLRAREFTAEPKPLWKLEAKFVGGADRSPHYNFHPMFTYQRILAEHLSDGPFNPEARRIIIERYLQLLEDEQTEVAKDYIVKISYLALERGRIPFRKEELPSWVFSPKSLPQT